MPLGSRPICGFRICVVAAVPIGWNHWPSCAAVRSFPARPAIEMRKSSSSPRPKGAAARLLIICTRSSSLTHLPLLAPTGPGPMPTGRNCRAPTHPVEGVDDEAHQLLAESKIGSNPPHIMRMPSKGISGNSCPSMLASIAFAAASQVARSGHAVQLNIGTSPSSALVAR